MIISALSKLSSVPLNVEIRNLVTRFEVNILPVVKQTKLNNFLYNHYA